MHTAKLADLLCFNIIFLVFNGQVAERPTAVIILRVFGSGYAWPLLFRSTDLKIKTAAGHFRDKSLLHQFESNLIGLVFLNAATLIFLSWVTYVHFTSSFWVSAWFFSCQIVRVHYKAEENSLQHTYTVRLLRQAMINRLRMAPLPCVADSYGDSIL